MGAHVTVANRTREKAKLLSKKFQCRSCGLNDRGFEEALLSAQIVISTVSTTQKLFRLRPAMKNTVLLNANYWAQNDLLKEARQLGCKIIDAKEWLLWQGAAAFKIFTDSLKVEPEVTTSSTMAICAGSSPVTRKAVCRLCWRC